MKRFLGNKYFLVVSLYLCVCDAEVKIVRHSSEINEDLSTFNYVYETANGIYEDQQGYPKDKHNLAVQGQIQFAAPNGQVVKLQYTADEHGYKPVGAHLPTPPPIPKAIQKALDWIKAHPEKEVITTTSTTTTEKNEYAFLSDPFLAPPRSHKFNLL